ncbi:RICIN domain-containing protein [Streptomyces sp. NPDC001880]
MASTPGNAVSASPGSPGDPKYQIRNLATGMCLYTKIYNMQEIHTGGCNSAYDDQQWRVTVHGDYVLLQNVSKGSCAAGDPRTNRMLYPDSCGSEYAKWTVKGELNPTGTVTLVQQQGAVCMDSNNDGKAYTWTCSMNSDRQKWQVSLVP